MDLDGEKEPKIIENSQSQWRSNIDKIKMIKKKLRVRANGKCKISYIIL